MDALALMVGHCRPRARIRAVRARAQVKALFQLHCIRDQIKLTAYAHALVDLSLCVNHDDMGWQTMQRVC